MSDLQCPARIFWVRATDLAPDRALAALAHERLAAVYDEPDEPDLTALADRHRGEAVLVVGAHGYRAALVLVEVDADGTRVSSWPTGTRDEGPTAGS